MNQKTVAGGEGKIEEITFCQFFYSLSLVSRFWTSRVR